MQTVMKDIYRYLLLVIEGQKGTKRQMGSTAGNNPTVEILVLRVYGMIRHHVHYPVSARYTNGLS